MKVPPFLSLPACPLSTHPPLRLVPNPVSPFLFSHTIRPNEGLQHELYPRNFKHSPQSFALSARPTARVKYPDCNAPHSHSPAASFYSIEHRVEKTTLQKTGTDKSGRGVAIVLTSSYSNNSSSSGSLPTDRLR